MKISSCTAAAVFACFAFGSLLYAQAGSLLVLSKRDRTLAIVDPVSLKVLGKVPVGDDPHEVVASSDGRTAYVSNYGSGTFHTLAVVDLLSRKALPSIDLGALAGPHGLVFTGGKTWFTVEGSKALARFDPATHAVDMVLGTGQNRTHMIYVAPDGEHIITTNVKSGTVSMIDQEMVKTPAPGAAPRLDWNETVVKVGDGSEGFDVSPDGKEIWVGNAKDGTISVIDRAAKQVVQTLAADVVGANRIKFTPDGKHVLVSSVSGPNLVVLNAGTRKVTKRVPIGHGAAGIVMEPGGARAFVACSPDNYVAVIDLRTMSVTGRLEVGDEPDGMNWALRQ